MEASIVQTTRQTDQAGMTAQPGLDAKRGVHPPALFVCLFFLTTKHSFLSFFDSQACLGRQTNTTAKRVWFAFG